MDLIKSFLPNPKTVGYSPFPDAKVDREALTQVSAYHAFSRFSTCCRAAFNRTIVAFCDPSLYQCKEELTEYVKGWYGDGPSRLRVMSSMRQEVDPFDLPWKPKPQYVAFLQEEGRLKSPPSASDDGTI
mmetsp:Transcript_17385/g.19811  ORF Transcript_17385/g.19811 Transcript_17385/m.19811 type:complete len:129 (-) Transcript_17385:62-448(-)